MSRVQSAYRRYQSETSLSPLFAPSDLNDPIGVQDALRGSTLLDMHEQGVIWLSLLLTSQDPGLRPFQDESIQHSSNPQYGSYAPIFEDIDHRTADAVAQGLRPAVP